MATTIKQSFTDFASNLNITDRQESIVSTCRKNVVKAINKYLYLHEEESKLIGSWDRKTLIRPLSQGDVDLMVILHYGKNKDWDTSEGSVLVLNKFKSIFENEYPKTESKRDRNCITMQLSEFRLDVVPAFKFNGGYYYIPDSIRKLWIKTDPFKFAEKITGVNKKMNDTFVPIIKMVKAWNRNTGSVIHGFHLECMLYNHYKTYIQSYTYSSTLKVFFEKLPAYITASCVDPITSERVDGYMDNSAQTTIREMALSKAKIAASKSGIAYEYEEKGYHKDAIDKWKELFGDYFPVYG